MTSVALQRKVTQEASMESITLREVNDLILKEMLRSAQHDTVGFVGSPI